MTSAHLGVPRHRHRPAAWPWWIGAAVGAVPQAGLLGLLFGGTAGATVVRYEAILGTVAVLLSMLLLAPWRTRRAAAGMFAATALGVVVVVATAFALNA